MADNASYFTKNGFEKDDSATFCVLADVYNHPNFGDNEFVYVDATGEKGAEPERNSPFFLSQLFTVK